MTETRRAIFTPATMHGSQVGMKKDLKYTPALPSGLGISGHSLTSASSSARYTPAVLNRMNLKYTPAWIRNNIDPNAVYREYTLDWWTDTAIFNYDALLVSAFYGMNVDNFREHYGIPRKDFLLVGDSGGFQVFSQGIKIEPIEVLKWQENNCDIGLSLDVPPVSPVVDWKNFESACKQSKRNLEIMHRNRSNEDMLFYKVIQGDNKTEMEYWWNQIKEYETEGVSIAPRPVDAERIGKGIGFVMGKEIKNLHVLLGTGPGTIPVIIYAKKWFDLLTVDSASFSRAGAAFRNYYLPNNPSSSLSFGDAFARENPGIKILPCDCPICSLATVDELNAAGSPPGGLIALHNLYITLRQIKILDSLSDDRERFFKYLEYNGYHDCITTIEFLEMVNDHGFEDAYRAKYGKESRAEEWFV